jgi:4'-phosphopantetheinyl transferase
MSSALEFAEAVPRDVAGGLDGHLIHLWRLPYAMSQGRAPLLALLASYLDVPASSIALDQHARGKPRLAPGSFASDAAAGRLEFNWSHSGDFALVALTRGCELGVDIERFGKNPRSLEIARRFFDPIEAEALARLEPAARDRAFIKLWCAKEAVLKAVGEGLSFGLARLAFVQCPDADWTLTRVDPALGDSPDWQLASFEAAPGYRGALAWRGQSRAIAAFRTTSIAD